MEDEAFLDLLVQVVLLDDLPDLQSPIARDEGGYLVILLPDGLLELVGFLLEFSDLPVQLVYLGLPDDETHAYAKASCQHADDGGQ